MELNGFGDKIVLHNHKLAFPIHSGVHGDDIVLVMS